MCVCVCVCMEGSLISTTNLQDIKLHNQELEFCTEACLGLVIVLCNSYSQYSCREYMAQHTLLVSHGLLK